MSLLDLNDFVLLRVFSNLNLRDSINFAETCVRLRKVAELAYTKYKHFDLFKYEHFLYVLDYNNAYYDDDEEETEDENEEEIVELEPISADKVVSHIGKEIITLSIDFCLSSAVQEAVRDNCINVTSLKIYEFYESDKSSKWNTWLEKLSLVSLTIQNCDNFNEICGGISTLTELKFTTEGNGGFNGGLNSTDLYNLLEKNPNLERLKIQLYDADFEYDIFTKLPKLRCLDIMIDSGNLANLTEVLKINQLTEFKLFLSLNFRENLKNLNPFLKILAEKAEKLVTLQLDVDHVDENTFRTLNLFNLTSLGCFPLIFEEHLYCCQDCCNCTSKGLVNAVPNLKHLNCLRQYISIEQTIFFISNLKKLETFCFRMDEAEELEKLLNETEMDEILKNSIDRPTLTLYINCCGRNGVKIVVSPKIALQLN